VEDSSSLRLRAEAALRAGRLNEAIAVLEQWAATMPDDAAPWRALAECLAAAGRPELAVAAWDSALAIDPLAAAALGGKAKALQALGRPREAADLFERALVADPQDFEAHFGLAMLAIEAGDLASAQAAIERLTKIHPDQPGTLWLTARIAAARGQLPQARRAVERLLAKPGQGEEARAEALLLKSQIFDRLSLPARAFAAAVEAKAIQKRLFAHRAAGREGETQKLRRLAAWFQTAARADWRAPEPSAEPAAAAGHIFLVGFPRSGTTLIEQALAGHPDVITLEEAPTMAASYAEFLQSSEGLQRLAHLTPDEARIWRDRYWQAVRAFGGEPTGRVFVDKAPAGTANLPIVAKLFPRAKVLFAVRDPRDVTLSCLLNAFQMNALTYAFTTLDETAACYGACMSLADAYRGVLDLELREVRYETLVEDFEAELAAIAGFVGLDFHPAMFDVTATARRRSVRTPSADQVRQGVNRQGVGRWRAYGAELAPVMPSLAPWIERFGYSD
jgi:Tfp pilus assembly protein PilF